MLPQSRPLGAIPQHFGPKGDQQPADTRKAERNPSWARRWPFPFGGDLGDTPGEYEQQDRTVPCRLSCEALELLAHHIGKQKTWMHAGSLQLDVPRIFGSSHTGSHLHTCAGWDGRFSHGFGVLYEVRGHAGWAIVMGITVSEAVTIEAVRSDRGRIPPYTHTMRISHRQHGYALWHCSADTCHPASRSGYLPSRCPLLSP